jgi:phosphocarrier protein
MSENLTHSRQVTVVNSQGLHLRPAGLLAETAARFSSRVEFVLNDMRVDVKSVLAILTLGAGQGCQLVVEATGPDAADAVTAVADLVSSGFPGATGPDA